jgi:hypothetical protein
VEDGVAAAHGRAHGLEVEDLALDRLGVEVAKEVEALRVAVAGANRVAALDERARDVGADESRGAGDEDLPWRHRTVPTPAALR